MKLKLSGIVALAIIGSTSLGAAEKLTTGTINVISATPLPSIGVPIDQIPSNVQLIKGSDLKSQQSLNLADYLNNNLTGVNVNEAQNNPYQADVNYHGFTASPLLGTPQGLSVYQDGVRINEPFGDTVNWDLIPKNAISNIALMPGSNPLFGLNTLGGALSINTKSGDQYPGFGAQAYAGSWGRWAVEGEGGGKLDNGANYFFAGNKFKETGWRDSSPSDVLQGFGKLGWSNEKTRFDLSFSGADNSLVGNGYQSETLMQNLGYSSIYTKPDQTKNKMSFVNLNLSHSISNQLLLTANIYYRHTKTTTLNADVNDLYEALITACDGLGAGGGTFTLAQCAGKGYDQGVNNRSTTRNNGFGSTVQLSWISEKNLFTSGISYVGSRVKFTQTEEEFSTFSSARGAGGTLDAIETANNLKGSSNTWSLFAVDTYNLTSQLALTASGRYNYTKNKLTDLLAGSKEATCIDTTTALKEECDGTSSTVQAAAGDAGGRHQYSRFNPAVGLAYAFMPSLNGYAGYNEGSRAPSPIENGCADPAYPCLLPNAMAGDPPLKQVVTKTFEAGFRGKLSDNIRWSAGAYHANNFNDIQFIASGTTGAGYFNNVGKTRRQGLDLAMSGIFDKFRLHAGYSYIDATYESTFNIASEANSSRVDGPNDTSYITVNPGNKMVGIPEHQLKLRGEWLPQTNLMFGASLVAFSDQYARGNENNQHVADGNTYHGSGKVAGYSVLNLDARYNFSNSGGWQLFAKANNVFDHKYSTSGLLGENIFNNTGNTFSTDAESKKELFLAPGAPRALWIGLRYDFGGAKKGGMSD